MKGQSGVLLGGRIQTKTVFLFLINTHSYSTLGTMVFQFRYSSEPYETKLTIYRTCPVTWKVDSPLLTSCSNPINPKPQTPIWAVVKIMVPFGSLL